MQPSTENTRQVNEDLWIKNWATDDRPREKLLAKGPSNLSDSELLAILIRCGRPDRSAVELAREILKIKGGDLNELGRCHPREFMKIKGIGLAKAITISAALELGRRRETFSCLNGKTVRDSREVVSYLRSMLADHDHEVFGALYLNQANHVLQLEILSNGGITCTVVDTRMLFAKALECKAVSMIIFHNHPSGNPKPSKADEALTEKINEAGKIMEVKLLDHLIVGTNGYFSFANSGLLKP